MFRYHLRTRPRHKKSYLLGIGFNLNSIGDLLKHIEADLQKQVEAYLRLVGLKFVHIPGSLQRYIWTKSSRVPIHIAMQASRAFKGVPDLLIFKGDGKCLIMELKAPKGKLTTEQEAWLKLGMVVCKSLDDAIKIIDEWRN